MPKVFLIFSILFISIFSLADEAPDEPQAFKIYEAKALSTALSVRWENRGDVAFYEVAAYDAYGSVPVCKVSIHGGLYSVTLTECLINTPGDYILHMSAFSNRGLIKDSYKEFKVGNDL